MLWRVPLFLALLAGGLWFAFLGLVHLAFVFVTNELLTFIFAPALLPFAALPAICFLLCVRAIAWIWRNDAYTPGQKQLAAGGGPILAYVLAQTLDLIQVNLIRMMGIALPRLPLDPF